MTKGLPEMAIALRRTTSGFRANPIVLAAPAVLVALLVGRWWAFDFAPGLMPNLWAPYFIAPMGWVAAAGVGIYYYRQLPAPEVESALDRKTVWFVAALVGSFIVALQIVAGLFADFGKSPFAHSGQWVMINTFFAGAPLVAVEVARATLLRTPVAKRWTMLALVITSLGLVILQYRFAQFQNSGFTDNAEWWGKTIIPLCATGLLAGFFSLYGGWTAGLLVSAPLVAFTYYSPFLPVAEWPVLAMAGIAGPAMGLWIAEGIFTESEAEEVAARRSFFSAPSVAWVMTAVIALGIFWFSFGFFGFRPAFVPSGSMLPHIKQGDLVMAGPTSPGALRVGDIAMYELSNKQRILHRIAEIKSDEAGKRTFIFKGDNNNVADPYPVQDSQIKGKYTGRVPNLGWVPLRFQQGLQKVIK